MDDRGIKLLKLLPKYNGCVAKAGKEAGYSDYYLRKAGHSIVERAKGRLEREYKKMNKQKPPKKDHNTLEHNDIDTTLNTLEDNETSNQVINPVIDPVIERDELKRVIGLSKDDFKKEYISLITQQKDLSTKLKALQGISKYTGIDISIDSEQQAKAPMLNIMIKNIEPKQLETAQRITIDPIQKSESIELLEDSSEE